MAKVTLYSTASGIGFDMESDWLTKVGWTDLEEEPSYSIESATGFKLGSDSNNHLAVTHSTAVPMGGGDYDNSGSTWFTVKAIDAGKTLFTFSELGLTGDQIEIGLEQYHRLEGILLGGATSKEFSSSIQFALLQSDDSITGTAYRDVITSYAGRDTVNAGGGADKVYGGTSGDKLNGSSGDDRLYGETGNDTLTGGTGLDTFVFSTLLNASTNVDEITDFSVADDEIWLDNDVFTKAGAMGQLDSDAFHKGSSAADAQDRLIYNSSTGALYYDRDGTGTTFAKVLIAELDVGLAMTYKDFEVIG